jgi:2-oxoglutarate dehydrogenase E1 component
MSNEMQSQWNSSWLDSGNQSYLEDQYEIYLKTPDKLSKDWLQYFDQLNTGINPQTDISHADMIEYFKNLSYQPKVTKTSQNLAPEKSANVDHELKQIAVQKLIYAYRLSAHQCSNINPLATELPTTIPELELEYFKLKAEDLDVEFSAGDLAGRKTRTLNDIIKDLKSIYCGTVASEYMHIPDVAERLWVQTNLEQTILNLRMAKEEKQHILELIIAADGMERYLGAKYPGAKRFGLEGCDTLIVALDKIIIESGIQGMQEIVIAMAHRGRLNVLVNLLGKMPSELFDAFEGKHSEQERSGDVKYHQGFASDLQTPGGNLHVSMAFNPSHLEIVNPVATGSVRARQERRNDSKRAQVLCIAIHGDAAFAGQGVVMETLNMSGTRGFDIGGTVNIIINNQIGFTTSNPQDARSTMYCSDIGKMLGLPIFHVNADDPEAVVAIANLALQYKIKFHKDVIIDLVGYRRLGHNEADEPSATQPLMYKAIRAHPTVKKLYADKLIAAGVISQQEVDNLVDNYRDTLDKRDQAVVKNLVNSEWRNDVAANWAPYGARDWRIPTVTAIPLDTIKVLASARDKVPEGFTLNTQVKKIVEDRLKMTNGEIPVDWGYAETLAYATLLNDGYALRLSGQDCGRGTFFHRHVEWHDQNNGQTYISLEHLTANQAKCWIVDSLLSEAGVLGFEYGYSSSEPRTLTIWEAQFGDFANGAQVLIDQFISSGEQKWGRLSGLVMLLPHGYEGQGPEHSSARIERYLQLCAQHNIQVCIPSTPAQMYHLLRRQMLRPMRKPLIVITPKSLLRHKSAVSPLEELADGAFKVIIADSNQNYTAVHKVILCSGKIYYELDAARAAKQTNSIAILRVEQLYPFPEIELTAELSKYVNATEIVWCQEEPKNQGAWYSTQHHLQNALQKDQKLVYAGRGDSAAPAVGYLTLHEEQQRALVKEAIGDI